MSQPFPFPRDCLDDGPDMQEPQLPSSFEDLPLHAALLRGVYGYGWERPSAIQQRAIVPLISGRDLIAQAQSGTGKTGAFTIGLLQRMDFRPTSNHLQAIVLAPTRELVDQTYGVLSLIGEYLSGGALFCAMFVGGRPVAGDIRRIQAGVRVAVGTPGRVEDLIKRGALVCGRVSLIVLDEADEMLSQGFSEQIGGVFKFLPKDVQVALFSATLPEDVLQVARVFMRDPTTILMKRESLPLDGIKQFYVAVEEEDKLATLMDLYDCLSVAQSVIFANTRRKVEYISSKLNASNHAVGSLHAEMMRAEREHVMQLFKAGTSRVLVTTDLVARGIDVHRVNMVVNYDLTTSKEDYLHRIGRCGRYGKVGIAINFVSRRDVELLREIEEHYTISIEELPLNFTTLLDSS